MAIEISVDGVLGTIYLSGTAGEYTGSGTPWTSQSTTPYELSNNDVTGNIWTPQAAIAQTVYGGGPPFRMGQTLISKNWANVTETLGVQMRATSHNSAVELLRQLRQLLNQSIYSRPAQLIVKPNGATSAVYFDIYQADVQELATHFYEGTSGHVLIRAAVTWTRSPFGSRLTSGETLINAGSFGNTGTGSPDNVVAYSAAAGELIYDGQPLNLDITFSSSAWQYCAATIQSMEYSTTGNTTYTTSSTTGATTAIATTFSADAATDIIALRGRFLIRFTSPSSNIQVRITVIAEASGTLTSLYTSPWITPDAVSTVVDFGGFPLDSVRNTNITSANIAFSLGYRSTNGASASITLHNTQFLQYYTFCNVALTGISAVSGTTFRLASFVERSLLPAQPFPYPTAFLLGSGRAQNPMLIRGRAPVYIYGSSLYLMWYDRSGGTDDRVHTTTRTATVTVTGSPLYHTLRGAG